MDEMVIQVPNSSAPASPTPPPPVSDDLEIGVPAAQNPEPVPDNSSAPSSHWIAVAIGVMGLGFAGLGVATSSWQTKAGKKFPIGIYLGVATLLVSLVSILAAYYVPHARRGESKLGRVLMDLCIYSATTSLFVSFSIFIPSVWIMVIYWGLLIAIIAIIIWGSCKGSTASV